MKDAFKAWLGSRPGLAGEALDAAREAFAAGRASAEAELVAEREKTWKAVEELLYWHDAWERLPKDPVPSPSSFQELITPSSTMIRMRGTYALRIIGGALMKLLDDMAAKNSIEAVTSFEGRFFTVEVRRLFGKSMAELRAEALAELDAARAELARVKGLFRTMQETRG